MTELKPCPFHEGPHILDATCYQLGQRFEYWSVSCEVCGAKGQNAKTEQAAIAAWNTRDYSDIIARIEALRVDVPTSTRPGMDSLHNFILDRVIKELKQ